MSELVVAAPDQEVDLTVGEDVLGLEELPGVALVEEVIYPVSVYTNSPWGRPSLGHLLRDLDAVVNTLQLLHGHLLVAERSGQNTGRFLIRKVMGLTLTHLLHILCFSSARGCGWSPLHCDLVLFLPDILYSETISFIELPSQSHSTTLSKQLGSHSY